MQSGSLQDEKLPEEEAEAAQTKHVLGGARGLTKEDSM